MNNFTHINHDKFESSRGTGIGASEISILCGHSTFKTPYELWLEKTGQKKFEPDEELKSLFLSGHHQEPITAYRYFEEQDKKLAESVYMGMITKTPRIKENPIQIYTRFHHKKHDFMYCHPDIIDHDLNVELKYALYSKDFDINDLTESGIPFKYYLQIQYQMLCTGLKKSYLFLNKMGGNFYKFGPIIPNEEVFEQIEKLVYDFWQLVEKKEPPMPESRNDVKSMFPEKKFLAKTIPEDLELITIMQKDRYNIIKEKISKMKKEQDKIKTNISALMTDNNVLQTVEGDIIAKISSSKSEKIKALSKIKKDNPEIYNYLLEKGMIEQKENERMYL